jgi:hypothetical protein
MTRSGDYGGYNENRWDILDRIHPDVVRALAVNSVDPNDFADLYGEDNVTRDSEEAARKKKQNDERRDPELVKYKKRSMFFELLICSGDQNDWYGPDATVVRTSDYDDIVNGVDAVLEFDRPESPAYIALAIDVAEMGQIEDKLKKIRQNMERGKMAKVKYFVSEHGFRGELSKIPEVIVAAFGDDLYELSLLWAQKDKNAIAKHPIQLQVLEEVRIQLVSFRAFVEFLGNVEQLPSYDRVLTIIEGIIEIKRPLREELVKAGTWSPTDNPSIRSLKKNIAAIFPEIAQSVQL